MPNYKDSHCLKKPRTGSASPDQDWKKKNDEFFRSDYFLFCVKKPCCNMNWVNSLGFPEVLDAGNNLKTAVWMNLLPQKATISPVTMKRTSLEMLWTQMCLVLRCHIKLKGCLVLSRKLVYSRCRLLNARKRGVTQWSVWHSTHTKKWVCISVF